MPHLMQHLKLFEPRERVVGGQGDPLIHQPHCLPQGYLSSLLERVSGGLGEVGGD